MKEKNWTGLKITAILGALLFAVVLAYVVGTRLSSEAIAVLAGSVCGVGAAIPTSLIIVAVSRRNGHSETRSVASPQMTQPVVMMAPPVVFPQQQLPQPQQQPTWNQTPAPRQYTVVGEEEDW